MLLLLVTHVDLQQHSLLNAGASRALFYFFDETRTIDGMDQCRVANDLAHLVGLESSDHMEVHVGGDIAGELVERVLDTILAEVSRSCSIGRVDSFTIDSLAYSNERDFVAAPSCA